MRIGILTHRLFTNYGGILQNYALQVVLKRLGHDVITIDYVVGIPTKIKLLSFVKRLFLRILKKEKLPLRAWMTDEESAYISQFTRNFIQNYINLTKRISLAEINNLNYDFDCIIVGSDQVWRYNYFKKNIEEFFLKSFDNVPLKLSYAASFGTDIWEMPKEQTSICRNLVQKFKSVSVREQSGIDLCNKYLGVPAELVLDPTLLLSKDDYVDLIKDINLSLSNSPLMTYILDKSEDKRNIIQYISEKMGLEVLEILPDKSFSQVGAKGLDKCIVPQIEYWLKGFLNSEFVVTDSFHGTVFSIIFNKPFIVIGNKLRGLDRMNSLLNIFNLEDRLVLSYDDLLNKNIKDIKWDDVNEKLSIWKSKSMCFIKQNLNENV